LLHVTAVESKFSFPERQLSQDAVQVKLEKILADEFERNRSLGVAWSDANGDLSQQLQVLSSSYSSPSPSPSPLLTSTNHHVTNPLRAGR